MSAAHKPTESLTAYRAVEADTYAAGTQLGSTIDLAGKRGCIFIVTVGTIGEAAVVDAFLQDSPNGTDWTDVDLDIHPECTIPQIDTADGAGAAMSYSHGGQRYVRAVLVVGVETVDAGIAACSF